MLKWKKSVLFYGKLTKYEILITSLHSEILIWIIDFFLQILQKLRTFYLNIYTTVKYCLSNLHYYINKQFFFENKKRQILFYLQKTNNLMFKIANGKSENTSQTTLLTLLSIKNLLCEILLKQL